MRVPLLVVILLPVLAGCRAAPPKLRPHPSECSLLSPHAPPDPSLATCLSFESCVVAETGHVRCVELSETHAVGEPCVYEDECAAGLVCVESIGCRQWCVVGSGTCGGGSCVRAYGVPEQAGLTLGFCASAAPE